MKTLTTTQQLADFCEMAAKHPYVTIDTEFLRERTYYSKLCLVQLAVKGDDKDCAVLVDPLVDGLVVSRKWWKLISGTSERVGLCAGQAAWSRVASATG